MTERVTTGQTQNPPVPTGPKQKPSGTVVGRAAGTKESGCLVITRTPVPGNTEPELG